MAGMEDMFPEGLRVLVVDDNLTCLRILELLLQRCRYKVTGTQEAAEALKMLTETPKKYDIVLSDVHMPGMDGFQLLENIGLYMEIPVIMLSANDDYALVMRGIKHGAVDYLIKPVRIEELKNIWQHVVRRRNQDRNKGKASADEKEVGADPSKDGKKSTTLKPEGELETRKRKDNADDGDDEDGPISDNHGPSGSKRQRVVWSPDLHRKFVNAVDQLGPEKAFPKKILDIMNVEGLTRENVASHLQKYRLYLKRMTYMMTMGQPMDPTLTPFGAQDSSFFRPRGAMLNPYGPFTNLESSLSNGSMGLTLPFQPSTTNGALLKQTTNHSRNPRGHIAGGIPCTNQFQMNNNQVTIGRPTTQVVEGLPNQPTLLAQYSGYRPQSGVPSQQNYTRCMENWQNNSVSHEAIQQNQAPPIDFNGGVSSTEISNLQNALERASIDVPIVTQSRRFDTLEVHEYSGDLTNLVSSSNGGDQLNQWFGESNLNPYGAFSNLTYGHVAGINTSSGLQNTEAQAREANVLLNLDENYLHDEPNLLAGFHVNANDSLTDIIERLLD